MKRLLLTIAIILTYCFTSQDTANAQSLSSYRIAYKELDQKCYEKIVHVNEFDIYLEMRRIQCSNKIGQLQANDARKPVLQEALNQANEIYWAAQQKRADLMSTGTYKKIGDSILDITTSTPIDVQIQLYKDAIPKLDDYWCELDDIEEQFKNALSKYDTIMFFLMVI